MGGRHFIFSPAGADLPRMNDTNEKNDGSKEP
jgi:hypothetical protein